MLQFNGNEWWGFDQIQALKEMEGDLIQLHAKLNKYVAAYNWNNSGTGVLSSWSRQKNLSCCNAVAFSVQ